MTRDVKQLMTVDLGRGMTADFGTPVQAETDRLTDASQRSHDRISPEPEGFTHEKEPGAVRHVFTVLATRAAKAVGSIWAFSIAALVVIVWAVLGPVFHYSDTWQLVINTGTTIVTFLMVFLIQNSQNRDSRAMQLKLDELILTAKEARNELINIEKMSDEELESMAQTYEIEKARRASTGREQ
jgi:low affinity Fe/Cu permease